MKESTLVQMRNDIDTLKNVCTRAIQQLDYQQNVIGGILGALDNMEGYHEAVDKMVAEAKAEVEAQAPKTELE